MGLLTVILPALGGSYITIGEARRRSSAAPAAGSRNSPPPTAPRPTPPRQLRLRARRAGRHVLVKTGPVQRHRPDQRLGAGHRQFDEEVQRRVSSRTGCPRRPSSRATAWPRPLSSCRPPSARTRARSSHVDRAELNAGRFAFVDADAPGAPGLVRSGRPGSVGHHRRRRHRDRTSPTRRSARSGCTAPTSAPATG